MTDSINFNPYGLPPEISVPAIPLIDFVGLQIKVKKSHQAIWEGFTLNKGNERIALKLTLIDMNLQIPIMKQKKQSYEWFSPKGILKSNWINKYLNIVPSLIVLFWDLEWNEPNWKEKINNIASAFKNLKLILSGRNTRLAIVLVQECALNPNEDGTANSEKAAALCAACDLAPKHLFLLPHTDSHLLGYIIRLENAFNDVAGGFYMGAIKNVKGHQNFLNKTNHQLLFIRHQFKIAFFNEMRNDMHSAIKHYSQSYNYLLEHRFTNTNLHEIRTIAAIINYKICKLNFNLNLPRDAIEQFRKHIEVFRQRTGPSELIFEHYAWLSEQYELFGQLFEDAVSEGLPAVQTQHPGFYYQQASNYAVLRRNTAFQVCKKAVKPHSNLLEGWDKLEYYGQRPWRPGKHTLEPPEMGTETEGIEATCFHETNNVVHSSMLLPLFSSAIGQFKKYRCPRIKRLLMTQMAREYLETNDPQKALTLLSHVIWDYRSESWFSLLSSISLMALECAYKAVSVTEFISESFEILGPNIAVSEECKGRVFENLISVINGKPPTCVIGEKCEPDAAASELWSQSLSSQAAPPIRMDEIIPFLQIRAGFVSSTVNLGQFVELSVIIRNFLASDFGLILSLTVLTDSSSMPQLVENDKNSLCVKQSSSTTVKLTFRPSLTDLGKSVNIIGLKMNIGNTLEKSIVVHWSGNCSAGSAFHNGPSKNGLEVRVAALKDAPDIKLHSQLSILSRKPMMKIKTSHDDSSLVWEWLPVVFEFQNDESDDATDVLLSVNLEPGSDSALERTTQVSMNSTTENKLANSSILNHVMPNIPSGQTVKSVLYVKALTVAKRTFKIKVTYKCRFDGTDEEKIPIDVQSSFTLLSKIPFQVSVETHSMELLAHSKFARGERFLVVPRISCFSHVPLIFTHSSLSLNSHVNEEGENKSQVADAVISDGEEATDCFCLSINSSDATVNSRSLGQYLLYWKRSEKNSPVVSVSITLPKVTLDDYGLSVEADVPCQASVRSAVTAFYTLKNTGEEIAEIICSMHASDAFMFSGPKEHRIRILPSLEERISFNFYPLVAGFVQLPRLSLVVESPPAAFSPPLFNDFILRILPSHIFVMPQEKMMSKDVS